jgi:hypothetical protein
MPEQSKRRAVQQATQARASAREAHVFGLGERWLCPADKLDYLIRRWAIPDYPFDIDRAFPTAFASPSALSEQTVVGTSLISPAQPDFDAEGRASERGSSCHREISLRIVLAQEAQSAASGILRRVVAKIRGP